MSEKRAISQMNSNPKLVAASKLALCALLLLPVACGLKAIAKEEVAKEAGCEQSEHVQISQVGDFSTTEFKPYTRSTGFPIGPADSDDQTPPPPPRPIVKPLERKSKLFAEPTFDDLFGMSKNDLFKRFPSPNFKHKADFSQITWHGTDVSSVLELRFKKGRVSQLRLSTHYGYPRPGTTSDVEVGKWLTKK
jgi:hypothetical protein